MAGQKYYWLKLKEDFFDDKVIKYLRKMPEGPTLVIIYLKMQLKSLKTEGFLKYDGIFPTCEEELAILLDEPLTLVTGVINALEKMGVVERWENDVLYMKAMQELIGKESEAAARVRKHRELKKNKQLPQPEALQCNANVTRSNENCNTEIEIEIEKEIEKENKDRERSIEERVNRISFQTVCDLYNSICLSYPKIKKLSEARKKAIKARMSSGYTVDDFKTLFEKAEASSFLKGANKQDWRATFDWLITDSNMAKVLDGNYDNKNSQTVQSSNPFLEMLRQEGIKNEQNRDY